VGAGIARFGSGDATTCASVYFAGGLFFNTGGYVSLLQVINAPRHVPGGEGRLVTHGWHWWSYEPARVDWLSAFVLFAGTLVFAVDLLDSFLQGLSVQQINRLIWAPDVIGCVLFLVAGHLAFVEIFSSTSTPDWEPGRWDVWGLGDRREDLRRRSACPARLQWEGPVAAGGAVAGVRVTSEHAGALDRSGRSV
jgi:hypothetical protein